MKLILERWQQYLNEVKFKNELGNEIVIEIKKVKDTGTNSKGEKEEFDAIEITMEGPTSTMTNTITRQEAEELHKALKKYLDSHPYMEPDGLQEEWSKSERDKRKSKCANPKGFTMKQFCKNQRTRSKKGQKTN